MTDSSDAPSRPQAPTDSSAPSRVGVGQPPPPPPQGEIPAWSRKYIGREIGFRFTIQRALAAGGMGSIFLGQQSNLDRQVAIKLVRTSEPETIQRMRQEAQSLAAVNHPAIVEVYDFVAITGSKASDCYLVMGYVPGLDLARYLDTVERGFLPPAEAVELLLPITSAMVELHARDMIHRDIKLSNIIRFEGADGVVRTKLVDFGFARGKQDPNLTAKGIVVGTPAYFAPEIALGRSHSPASDVYALGVTLCKLLTGQNPHGEVNIGELLQKAVQESVALPIWLMQTSLGPLVQSMLRREPERRPSMRQVLEGFQACLESLGELALAAAGTPVGPQGEVDPKLDDNTESTTPAGWRRPGRGLRGALWSLGALSVVLSAAVVFLVVKWTPRQDRRSTPPASAASPTRSDAAMHPAGPGGATSRPAQRHAPGAMTTGRRPSGAEETLPTVAELRLACDSQAEMRRMFHPARKVILGRRKGNLELARRTLEALLPAKCTPNVTRHWVSYYLTKAYVRQGKCKAARRAWTLYEQYQLRHRRKPSFPRCP